MFASSSSLVLLLPDHFHSRKLLFHNPLNSTTSSSSSYLGDSNFDTNVVMVLSVLLCALICSLGLNSIIRCALRCSNITSSSTSNPPSLVPHRPAAANTGVKKKALKTFPTITYDQKLPGLDDTECAICLCDFSNGDRLRILPKCNHGFHVRCIDKWLNSHSSCPKCRHCLIHTCEKIVGCASSGGITTTSQAQGGSSQVETMVRIIAPLEPEGVVREYR